MTHETFKLINAVQSEGIESWGVIENVNTRVHFGTDESIELVGQYLYLYQKRDEFFCFISQFKPIFKLAVANDEDINIYKIDQVILAGRKPCINTHTIMKTSNFRHKVFCMAHELMKATGKAFAVCLSRAWALYRLTKRMHKGVVTFAYEKTDGSLRKAKGTLKDVQSLIKGTGSESYKTIRYYDVDANGFRSFKIENFITVY